MSYRFDAPADEYGVLYASADFNACLAETVIRDCFLGAPEPLLIPESALRERSVSILGRSTARPLKLADFTQPLVMLGFTTEVLASPDYTASNLWSKAVYDHPEMFDGIYFTSRYANAPSIAIFDRVDIIARGHATPLMNEPKTAAFLEKYSIGLA